MKVTLFLTAALLPVSLALPTLSSLLQTRETSEEATDRLLFETSMADFQAARNAQDPSQLDWSSNGCSFSPDEPLGYDFHPCCQRHDFGYRNTKNQDRFDDMKSKIDNNFKQDMYDVCKKESVLKELTCRGTAEIYYNAVKEFGNRKRQDELEAVEFVA